MLSQTLGLALILMLLAGKVCGGLRPPGKYTGVVLFDRWGGCYLYSAIYLMYVPEARKTLLKPYIGKCMVLDAQEVYQPINPGDGRLERFTLVGVPESDPTYAWEKVGQLELAASLDLHDPRQPRWKLTVWNHGPDPVDLRAEELALTVFTKKPVGPAADADLFSPSDGPSTALVTRQSLFGGGLPHWQGTRNLGQQTVTWNVRDQDSVASACELPAGATKEFVVELTFTPGEYDLVFGYGGGTHDSLCIASRVIAVDVSSAGGATAPNADRR